MVSEEGRQTGRLRADREVAGEGQRSKGFAFSDWRKHTSNRENCLECKKVKNFGGKAIMSFRNFYS